MKNQLLKLTLYVGTLAIGGFLLYASAHYPQIANNPVAFSAIAGISWFTLVVFVLNNARTTQTQ